MLRKYRNRLHHGFNNSLPKVKRGMSCIANPAVRRHREAASAVRRASCVDMIPVDELPMVGGPEDEILVNTLPLDGMTLGKEGGDSARSMVSDGGLSRITTFTQCSNPTFSVVHRVWKSGSPLQADVVAVLAAVAEIIKEKNGDETDVEYFAALLSTLESTPSSHQERVAATAYLLHLIMKKVSKEMLQKQFSKIVQIIFTKLLEFGSGGELAVKNLLNCLGLVLRAQPASIWNMSSNRNMVVSSSMLCTHDKQCVRTMSRKVVRAILTDPVTCSPNGLHPAANAVGQFLAQHLETAVDSKNGATETVRCLCLLEGIMHKMPATIFKQLTEIVLKGYVVANTMVKCSSLQCIYRVLLRLPCDAALPTDTNALLIVSLRALDPGTSDVAVCAYWMQALVESHVCLTAKDEQRSLKLLPETMDILVKLFETGNDQLCDIIVQVLTRMTERCVKDDPATSRYLLQLLEKSLNLHTTLMWPRVLKLIMKVFETCGTALLAEEFVSCLRTLAALRDSEQCFCTPEIDFAIGAAVRYVGVQHVLNVLPLQIDPDAAVLPTAFKRSFLLPIFRVNIRNAPVMLFVKYFLPLAVRIHRRLPGLDPMVARLYRVLQQQIWDLLPSFLAHPSDFEEGFTHLAQVLGAALTERKDLSLTLLRSLRSALKYCLQPDASPERVDVMCRFAKNFMPILFNLFTSGGDDQTQDDNDRRAILDVIHLYCLIAPVELLAKYSVGAMGKVQAPETGTAIVELNRRRRLMDILCALSAKADAETCDKMVDLITPMFDDMRSHGLQKKAYRILGALWARRGESEIRALLDKHQNMINEVLVKPVHNIAAPALVAHQNLQLAVLLSIDNYEQMYNFCTATLNTTILGLDKANSVLCRESASKCLQEMMKKLVEYGQEVQKAPMEVLQCVLELIYSLLNPDDPSSVPDQLARAALVALNIVVQKQIKNLGAAQVSRLVSTTCSMIGESRTAIRLLVLRLIRVLVQKLPEFAMSQYRDQIVTAVFKGQSSDNILKIRKGNHILLRAMVERFGCGVLERSTQDPTWIKQMRNIDKINRRRARKEKGRKEEDGSDDGASTVVSSAVTSARTAGADTILRLLEDTDDEEEDDQEEMTERKSRAGSLWLKEDGEDVVDLLDNKQMMHKVTATDPKLLAHRQAKLEKKKANANRGFQMTKDGKLLIDLDSDDDEKPQRRKRGAVGEGDASDDDVIGRGGKRRRKKQEEGEGSDSDDDYESDEDEGKTAVTGTSRYKPGGRGIHRDTKSTVSRPGSDRKSQVGGKKGRPIAKAVRKFDGKGDTKKKGQRVDPFVYVPLRDKKRDKKTLKNLVGRKRGKAGMSSKNSTVGGSTM